MMDSALRSKIQDFVERQITSFHQARASALDKLELAKLLGAKNPYLFRAKNLEIASDLINSLLDARLSSSEEGMFGHFLEELAIFVSSETCSGKKSGIPGIDIELEREGSRYLVAVKSGKNWGNRSQHDELRKNFKSALATIHQSGQSGQVWPTLGICYGRFAKKYNGLYLHIGGQQFWELISGSETLYRELIEPIGYRAKEFNDGFIEKRAILSNRLTKEFLERFCTDGKIDWQSIADLVSKNHVPKSLGG